MLSGNIFVRIENNRVRLPHIFARIIRYTAKTAPRILRSILRVGADDGVLGRIQADRTTVHIESQNIGFTRFVGLIVLIRQHVIHFLKFEISHKLGAACVADLKDVVTLHTGRICHDSTTTHMVREDCACHTTGILEVAFSVQEIAGLHNRDNTGGGGQALGRHGDGCFAGLLGGHNTVNDGSDRRVVGFPRVGRGSVRTVRENGGGQRHGAAHRQLGGGGVQSDAGSCRLLDLDRLGAGQHDGIAIGNRDGRGDGDVGSTVVHAGDHTGGSIHRCHSGVIAGIGDRAGIGVLLGGSEGRRLRGVLAHFGVHDQVDRGSVSDLVDLKIVKKYATLAAHINTIVRLEVYTLNVIGHRFPRVARGRGRTKRSQHAASTALRPELARAAALTVRDLVDRVGWETKLRFALVHPQYGAEILCADALREIHSVVAVILGHDLTLCDKCTVGIVITHTILGSAILKVGAVAGQVYLARIIYDPRADLSNINAVLACRAIRLIVNAEFRSRTIRWHLEITGHPHPIGSDGAVGVEAVLRVSAITHARHVGVCENYTGIGGAGFVDHRTVVVNTRLEGNGNPFAGLDRR